MRAFALAVAVALASTVAVAQSPTRAYRPNRDCNRNGADQFRLVVQTCITTALSGGVGVDGIIDLTNKCIESTQLVWQASYGALPTCPRQLTDR